MTSVSKTEKHLRARYLDREEFRHIAHRNLTLAGFTLTALSITVGFYRENLADGLTLTSLLLSSMLLFFLASQMAYEAERLWHGYTADILHYARVESFLQGNIV
jgi:hypothetical protein